MGPFLYGEKLLWGNPFFVYSRQMERSQDEGKARSFADDFYDDSGQAMYRSLPPSTVADAAARLSLGASSGSPLDDEPKYRDLAGPDLGGPGGFAATFDDSDQPVYRSLPAFAGGAAVSGGPSYRSMTMPMTRPADAAFEGGADMARKAYDADVARNFAAVPKAAPTPTPPPVPQLPFRLESSHVVSRGGCGDLEGCLDALTTLFRIHQVEADFKAKSNKCRFKCTAFPGYERVEFKVFLYSRPSEESSSSDPSDLVVEFQRRAGGALHFASLYRDLVEGLSKRKICEAPILSLSPTSSSSSSSSVPELAALPAPPALSKQSSFEPPALPFDLKLDDKVEPVAATATVAAAATTAGDDEGTYSAAQSLMTMAKELQQAREGGAVNGEACKEAASALAVISATKAGAAVFNPSSPSSSLKDGSSLLSGVVDLLQSPCGDIQRLAAVVLANVCEHCPEAHGDIVGKTNAIRSLVWLAQHAGEPTNRAALPRTADGKTLARSRGGVESVRHCVRALAKLSTGHVRAIEAAGGIEILEQIAASYRDDKVSLYAAECMVSASAAAAVTVS